MIGGLILAAGAGTRFGDQPKLLAPTWTGARWSSTRSERSARSQNSSGSWSCSARTPTRCSIRSSFERARAHRLRGLERRARPHRCDAVCAALEGRRQGRRDPRRRAADHPRGDRPVHRRAGRHAGDRMTVDRGTRSCSRPSRSGRCRRLAATEEPATSCVAAPRLNAAQLCSGRDVDTPTTWRRFAMKLEQSFEVSAPIEQVWKALIDVEHVAPCLPGRGDHRAQRRRQLQRRRSRSRSGRRPPPTRASSR